MEFKNSKHMFYYLKKVFISNGVGIPQGQLWLEEKCEEMFKIYNISQMKPPLNVDCTDTDKLDIELPELEISDIQNAFGD